jgi:hypothetical protein
VTLLSQTTRCQLKKFRESTDHNPAFSHIISEKNSPVRLFSRDDQNCCASAAAEKLIDLLSDPGNVTPSRFQETFGQFLHGMEQNYVFSTVIIRKPDKRGR